MPSPAVVDAQRNNNTPATENSEYRGKSSGRPIVYWPGWQNFDARASIQTDVIPLPIVPVHFQNWPGVQYQLSNGWQMTNYGQKASYDSYRRMLTSSLSNPNNVGTKVIPGEGRQPTAMGNSALVSQKTLQNTVLSNNNEPAMPTGYSLVGKRTFYG